MTFRTGHVALNVSDLDTSRDFYRKLFGFEVFAESTKEGRRFALLGLDRTLVLALWQQSEGRFATALPGLHHLSFEVPDIEAVRRAEAVIRELGAPLYHDGIVAHGEGASSGGVFFEDPDGIRLEIYAPAGAETAPVPTPGAPTCGFF
ncbi:hypothetical protein GCM10010156_45370 [Planobispora rosea]|uniref:VOC domain-containing protein n=1 Tax=Planobispora rosea TaxID=35762 RepID=A0A8J3S3H1_PLARO|nr:VOC family protein [Planobispora rosea]GGS81591.1 hypothetical protein GCM10010156_45370 [Planobispora rosea]GIH86130.1 hypothetical protein Pro02_45380 [Planobispora rosea]